MIRLRGTLKRQRRKWLFAGAVALLGLILALTHSAPEEHGMAEDQMAAAISICLAVLEAGTGLLLFASGLAAAARRPRSPAPQSPSHPLFTRSPAGPAWPRAGPASLQVFLR